MLFINVAQARTIDEIIGIVESSLLRPLANLLLVLATFVFLWGVVEFIANPSNEDARTTGKRHMIWGLWGMLIMLAVKAIIAVLQNFFASIG